MFLLVLIKIWEGHLSILCRNFNTNYALPGFSRSNTYMPLLNTESLLQKSLWKFKTRSPIANTLRKINHTKHRCFYWESIKLKTPLSYIMYISWIMKKYHRKLYSNSSQYNIQSSHTVLQKLANICANLLPPKIGRASCRERVSSPV